MRHELLAPAGSLDICKAVIAAGADAVYLGGDKFGARAYAPNFTRENIFEALEHAHLYGKKIFLTVNTLLKNKEIDRDLYEYLEPLYRYGLDAVIVQDYGVFQFIKKNFPDLPVHVSTQMSVASAYGAEFLQKQGAARIVTARELSLGEIRQIYDKTGIEIESFIHGALCYCYSGQCLMSSMLGGRSGNRGRCAQPCRLAYQVMQEDGKILRKSEKYPLSPKDLCTIELLPKLCGAGIYSFKIEGRMKQLAYAAGVTEIYRKYLDLYENDPENYQVDQRDLTALMQLGNRSGFTEGYYEMRNGRRMMALSDSSHSSGQAKDIYQPGAIEKIPVDGEVVIKKGQPAILIVSKGERLVSVTGTAPEAAQSRPLTGEEVEKRLRKTGDTPFCFRNLDIAMDDDIFLPVRALNELRRLGLEHFFHAVTGAYRRELPENDGKGEIYTGTEIIKSAKERRQKDMFDHKNADDRESNRKPFLNVQISSEKMLSCVLEHPAVSMVSLDMPFGETVISCAQRIREAGKQAGWCLPFVLREHSAQYLKKEASKIRDTAFDRIFVRSFDGLGFAETALGIEKTRIATDYNMYVFSQKAAEAFEEAGYTHYTASLELNGKELRHMPNGTGEFLLYGYVPLMVSAQCVYKNYDRCDRSDDGDEKKHSKNLYLKDRYFKKFFIKRNCKDCYNVIYNSQPFFLFHQMDAVRELCFASYRITFVSENDAQIKKILSAYEQSVEKNGKADAPEEKDSFTNGHFRRGVE